MNTKRKKQLAAQIIDSALHCALDYEFNHIEVSDLSPEDKEKVRLEARKLAAAFIARMDKLAARGMPVDE